MLAISELNANRRIKGPFVGNRELSDLQFRKTTLEQSAGRLGKGKTSRLP